MKKFSLYDLVMLGIFNAALVLFFYGTVMLLHFFPLFWGMMDPVVNLVLAPIFLFMLVCVPKTGALTIHGFIIGTVHLATGWWPGFIAGITAGLLVDGASLALGGYKRKFVAIGSVLLFVTIKAFIYYAPMYLFTYIPWFEDVLKIWPKEYIEKYTLYYAMGFLAVNCATCSVGLYLGQRLLKNQFINTRAYSTNNPC